MARIREAPEHKLSAQGSGQEPTEPEEEDDAAAAGGAAAAPPGFQHPSVAVAGTGAAATAVMMGGVGTASAASTFSAASVASSPPHASGLPGVATAQMEWQVRLAMAIKGTIVCVASSAWSP